MQSKQVTIQIVGWNSASALPEGLSALARIPSSAIDIVYIDNNSRDASVSLVRAAVPHATIIELPSNTGFSRAHNIGFARCRTPFVLVHNPDLIIDWAAVQVLLEKFSDPQLAAVQGMLLRSAASHEAVIDSVGVVLSRTLNGVERGTMQVDRGQYAAPAPLLAVTGAGSIFRLSALKSVVHEGEEVFDEDFFAYKEDVDLGWRLNRAGWKVMYFPIRFGIHVRSLRREGAAGWGIAPGEVGSRLRDARTRYSVRNWVWLVTKNVTAQQLLRFGIFAAARLAVFLLLSLLYWPFLTVWVEALRGLPRMLKKRAQITSRRQKHA